MDILDQRNKKLSKFKPINKALSHKEYIHQLDPEIDQY